jgi:hypothetical protein
LDGKVGSGGTGGKAGDAGPDTGPKGGSGGTIDAGNDGDAQIIIQCPSSVPANECDQGLGWALCDVQPLSDVPRPSVIKGSGPAMYWYGSDGTRYVFPNEQTFRSWFPEGGDCPMVYQVSDADLATVLIGGRALTIKPGSYLIKITTDPKVYAISCGGIIHWLESETVASQIFGSNWNQYIVDVVDPFLSNYRSGTTIVNPTDYDPVAELNNVPTPDQDIACRTP